MIHYYVHVFQYRTSQEFGEEGRLRNDALVTLHWLRIPERVQHKIAVLTYKLRGSAPRYLGPLVAVADLPGRRALRSASTSQLVVQTAAHQTLYCWQPCFSVAAAQVWNSLSETVVSSSSLQTFRRQLKTLFRLSSLLDWHRYSGLCSNVSSFRPL